MSLFEWPELGELPMVSCIMPTYGRPQLVPESVAMFLEQDYPHKELIVLNDCPGQRYAADLPGVRVINTADRYQSLGRKRNAAIALADGPLIAVWDDDDVYLPWRLSFSVDQLLRHHAPVYRPTEYWAYWEQESQLLTNRSVPGWISHPSTLLLKDVWKAVGGYQSITLGEDAEFFERIEKHLAAPLLTYPLASEDRFFILRGTSPYSHTSIDGGKAPPETTPGEIVLEPIAIQDASLNRLASQLIADRKHKSESP